MKSLPTALLLILCISVLFESSKLTADNRVADNQQLWIQSLLNDRNKPIRSNNYIFYCTGHHGIIWSLITSDSSGINLYRGTTHEYIEYPEHISLDTLSFIKANINTITWGLDSLLYAEGMVKSLKNNVYNPIYSSLYIIKDGKIISNLNPSESYSGPDSIRFNNKLGKLAFLMYWLAAPSSRPYLPIPSDTLLLNKGFL